MYAIGVQFAYDLNLRETSDITNKEIMDFLNKEKNPVSGRISELKKRNKIKTIERGKHIVNPLEIKQDIEEIVELFKIEN